MKPLRVLTMVVLATAAGQMMRAHQEGVFRAGTDAVIVTVSVRDRNHPLPGLTSADFQLLDNNVAQEISSTSADKVPVDVALVLDASGSLDGPAFAKLKSDIQKMADLLKADDRVRLVTFGSRVDDVLGLQPGTANLPLERLSAGGRTSLYDALAAALMMTPTADRPQLVFVVSDGFDTRSYFSPRQLETIAGYSSATLYLTFVSTAGIVPHRSALEDVVKAGGGIVLVPRETESLPDIFQKVLDDFRTTYVLRYSPRGVAKGGWHDIVVNVPKRKQYQVRARKGYEGS
jgi:VWFA-related protein